MTSTAWYFVSLPDNSVSEHGRQCNFYI